MNTENVRKVSWPGLILAILLALAAFIEIDDAVRKSEHYDSKHMHWQTKQEAMMIGVLAGIGSLWCLYVSIKKTNRKKERLPNKSL